jgi:hypothetical protein
MHRFRRRFEARLKKRWGKALDVYDTALTLATELGEQANARCHPRAAELKDFVFEALTRLHGRACLTASEIGALLRTGHATGANARWRTVHELATTAFFISEQGQDVAERYLLHDVIARCKAATQMREHADKLGEEVSVQEVEELKRARAELVAKYGRSFANNWGWAAGVLKKADPGFHDIAAATDMSHWAPYVRMASHGIHAGPRGGYFDLGSPDRLMAIPPGPSHFGLADPGGNALVSLGQATVALLSHCLELDFGGDAGAEDSKGESERFAGRLAEGILRVTEMKALLKLIDHGARLFVEVHKEMETVEPSSSEAPRLWETPRIEGPPKL